MNFDSRKSAADYFKPKKTRILFLAESPPSSPERYFYYPDVKKHDWLWIGLMKAIYGKQFKELRAERLRKMDWLKRFQSDGYRLIDAVKVPICAGDSSKVQIIKSRLDHIVDEIQKINPKQIVMVKATVYDTLYQDLENRGLPVVNAKLPFPDNRWQKKFQYEFGRLVKSREICLTHLCQ